MSYPRLEIHLDALRENARRLLAECRAHGIEPVGITKVCCGEPAVARALLEGASCQGPVGTEVGWLCGVTKAPGRPQGCLGFHKPGGLAVWPLFQDSLSPPAFRAGTWGLPRCGPPFLATSSRAGVAKPPCQAVSR